jgi:hypothetical protein
LMDFLRATVVSGRIEKISEKISNPNDSTNCAQH